MQKFVSKYPKNLGKNSHRRKNGKPAFPFHLYKQLEENPLHLSAAD
jgi:hypothetical protein